MRKIRYVKTEREKSPNWRRGKPINPKRKKEIVVVYLQDEYGTFYTWSPLSNEVNEVANSLIIAEELNFPNLKNPEPRPDITELRRLTKNLHEILE